MPIANRLEWIHKTDGKGIVKMHHIDLEMKLQDEQKRSAHYVHPYSKVHDTANAGSSLQEKVKPHDKKANNEKLSPSSTTSAKGRQNETDIVKGSSPESRRDTCMFSGVRKDQIPSGIGHFETYSDCDFTMHDPESLSALEISFPPNSNATFGLPRSVVPPETYADRYCSLVQNSIPDYMVAAISEQLVVGTHSMVPRFLVMNFKGLVKDLDKVWFCK